MSVKKMCFREASDSKWALLHCYAVTYVGSDFTVRSFKLWSFVIFLSYSLYLRNQL